MTPIANGEQAMAKAVAKINQEATSVEILTDVPNYLKKYEVVNPNKDNFDSSDIVLPHLKLLQGLSDECELFDKAKPGLFWHTGLNLDLGNEFNFVVCERRKRYLLQAPMEDGSGILARADDGVNWDRLGKWEVKIKGQREPIVWEIMNLNVLQSGLTDWGTYNHVDDRSPPAATLFYDYLVLLTDHLDWGPVMISLARSQIQKAKKGLNDLIAFHAGSADRPGRPMQSLAFRATSIDAVNDDAQNYKNWHFQGVGFVPEGTLNKAKECGSFMPRLRVVDVDQRNEIGASKEKAGDEY